MSGPLGGMSTFRASCSCPHPPRPERLQISKLKLRPRPTVTPGALLPSPGNPSPTHPTSHIYEFTPCGTPYLSLQRAYFTKLDGSATWHRVLGFPSFLRAGNTPHVGAHFVDPSICGWTLGCFTLALVSRAAMNIGLQIAKTLLSVPLVNAQK